MREFPDERPMLVPREKDSNQEERSGNLSKTCAG